MLVQAGIHAWALSRTTPLQGEKNTLSDMHLCTLVGDAVYAWHF
jgi:hypothetical protein